ncbi:AraC-like DNA-binding protein [Kribbella voronezhensis]|uniref:AraC-like DNA-binding protein n=1 Tax=Kribbella voronezhensis TaxID=2512212 RepID=A0A4R7T946_9ACTN|nr:helix-turn-helix domain-containing protein [Kribbella voronezhensis]TDU88375.1 AraC-like DNA-binding protein [Kribbella voronezhensis]
MGQSAIRRVRFQPPAQGVGDIEVNTLKGIRDRGGPAEFLTPQRLDFDLLAHLERGAAVHTVDFTDYSLRPGDILWIRAGQVHQWGAIDDIEGAVVLFGPHTVDDHTSNLIRSYLVRPRSHWPASELDGSPVAQALELLTISAGRRATERSDLRQAALAHSLAALLVQLALIEPPGGGPAMRLTHEAYGWFRDHLEEHFQQWHKVSEYADRLGYSARTLNRLARQYTGLSAKELIDERIVLEAKRRLAHGDAAVAEIAKDLGFDDASNFSSYFRRQTRLTPGAFRSRTRAGRSAG